jgi:hypothetical protein
MEQLYEYRWNRPGLPGRNPGAEEEDEGVCELCAIHC